ncbi:MBL fold metallo-hydrolase [Pedobacter sp. SYSU D00535]|uniref:MBL fold metallo-hydrolase n=1 Tax=Pedobacter sp. SYSU D00535 TaxID=2810308 RepID=UPI001A95B8F4|nr:MBL fold metallo-hydrolase [Pedobacter sp. SYSU D00535]
MERREFLKASGISLGLLASLNYAAFADFFSRAYVFKPLRNNVGIFTEQGGTIAWLANKDGIVVVDSQFPDPVAHLITELKQTSGSPFRYLINTHHHGDHTSGNSAFKGMVDQVVSHQNALDHLKKAASAGSGTQQFLPNKTFKDDMDFRVGDENIKLYYFGAGHTNGDAIIHFSRANIVHMGDLVFNRRFPFIDKPGGANIGSWIKVLDKTIKKFDKDTLFVFGHALDPEKVTGTAEDLKAFQNYLEKLLEFVGAAIKAGQSKESILKATSIPGAPEWKGQGIERSLNAAYQELTNS